MVVTKPQGENSDVLHKPKEGGAPDAWRPPAFDVPASHPGLTLTRSHQQLTSHFLMRPAVIPSIQVVPSIQARRRGVGPSLKGIGFSGPDPMSDTYGMFHPASEPDHIMDYEDATMDLREKHDTISKLPSIVATRPTYVPPSQRFLLKTENMSLPLCFDVTGYVHLKLLHHPDKELYVNGGLDSLGFRRILIQLKADLYVKVEPKEITVYEGQTVTRHTGQDVITAGSLTVIRRDKEIDVATGDTRVVILIHEKDGQEFLWPVLRQKPLNDTVSGILVQKPAAYEELQQSPSTRLRIKDQEIDVTRASAVDYSIVSSPTRDCWLMSAESALQRHLNDFIL